MKRTHLAGIIPVAGLTVDLEIATPPVLIPVDKGFSAIQKSVHECALAGCNTIWIVANQDLAPLVRKVVGEWVYDPVYYGRNRYGETSEHRKEIPIYYTPIDLKDMGRKDSYGWSILSGVYSAWRTANKISKWIVPDKYFISFPMSAHDIYEIRKHRNMISNQSNNFFMTHNGKTAKEGKLLPFTMTGDDYILCRRDVNTRTTKEYCNTEEGEKYPSKKLPLEERWSAKNFTLSEVINKVKTDNACFVEVEWFYDMSSWEQYRLYMGSDKCIKKPFGPLTKPRKHANIPYKN